MKEDKFERLKDSIEEAGEILSGEKDAARITEIEEPDVKEIRNKLDLTQEEFAGLMGISIGTLRNWEQGRRSPRGAARVLIWIAHEYPEIVIDTVKAHRDS